MFSVRRQDSTARARRLDHATSADEGDDKDETRRWNIIDTGCTRLHATTTGDKRSEFDSIPTRVPYSQ